MRELDVGRMIEAPAEAAWALLTDVRTWSQWGPTVRGAEIDGGGDRIGPGVTGSVRTIAGVSLPFRITDWEDGRCWSWNVASLPATSHHVRPLGDRRCEVAFGVPWPAAPYAMVCRVALRRIDALLTG